MSLVEQNELVSVPVPVSPNQVETNPKKSCNMEYFLTLFFNIINDHEFGILHTDTFEEITETHIRASMEEKVSTSVDEFFDVYNTQWEIGDPDDRYSEPDEFVKRKMCSVMLVNLA